MLKMAVQMAEDDDIEVKYVVANDDVASAPKAVKEQRHWNCWWIFHVESRWSKSSKRRKS